MTNDSHQAHCGCRATKLKINGPALTRFYCHCEICQEVYNAPYSDFFVFQAKDIINDDSNLIDFAKYKLPPALDRGLCVACAKPVLAYLKLGPLLDLAFVPSACIDSNQTDLLDTLPAQGHLFYHRRQKDIHDNLPKYKHYWTSELAISSAIVKGMLFT